MPLATQVGEGYLTPIGAGWSSPVARQAHNLKVVGSNPTPATNVLTSQYALKGLPPGGPFAFGGMFDRRQRPERDACDIGEP